MQLALKKSPASDAGAWDKALSWLIKARLASSYCHGGIVIDGDLYHVMPREGLCRVAAGDWSPQRWDLFDIPRSGRGTACRAQTALALFKRFAGADYDWLSLLAFVGLPIRDHARFYCFEWCYLGITQRLPHGRVTPERLLSKVLRSQALSSCLNFKTKGVL